MRAFFAWLLASAFFLSQVAQAQPVYTPQDQQAFNKLLGSLQAKRNLPSGQLLGEVAKAMQGTPYVHHPIETKGAEKLVGNLKAVDCVTFVDNAIALTWALRSQPSFDRYLTELQGLRYYTGKPASYADRFHYMTHLLRHQETKRKLKILGTEVGAVPYKKTVNFMTQRVKQYPQLKDPVIFKRIAQVEQQLSATPSWYIPKPELGKQIAKIKDGDIIAITSKHDGLDVSHMGIASWRDGQLYMIHASRDFKKVMYSTRPLLSYMSNKPDQGGVMVARLVN